MRVCVYPYWIYPSKYLYRSTDLKFLFYSTDSSKRTQYLSEYMTNIKTLIKEKICSMNNFAVFLLGQHWLFMISCPKLIQLQNRGGAAKCAGDRTLHALSKLRDPATGNSLTSLQILVDICIIKYLACFIYTICTQQMNNSLLISWLSVWTDTASVHTVRPGQQLC